MVSLKYWFQLFLCLFILWMLLTLKFTFLNFTLGIILCSIVTHISFDIFYDNSKSTIRIPNIMTLLKYSIMLIIEIYKASFINMMRIIKNDSNIAIVQVKLEVKNPLLVIIICNSITLTPGTITIDWNKNNLYVLTIKDDGCNGKRIEYYIKEKFEKYFI